MIDPVGYIKNFEYDKGTPFDGFRFDTKKGDCDDFALTLAVLSCGGILPMLRQVLRGNVTFWRAHSPTNKFLARHLVLEWKGSYIDSTRRVWRSHPKPHKLKYRIRLPLLIPYVLWGATVGRFLK